MRYLSLFSGIEAATAAWSQLGWECAAVSDIDPFSCAYLQQCHPGVPNLGDVTQITEAQVAALGSIDLVVFGSPCQDLSVAGKRKGLDGERSGLFFAAMRIVEWARKHGGCRFALWENVPGAFSSNGGADFGAVVGQMAGSDTAEVPSKGWGTEGTIVGPQGMVEWSVLDAQWFGVAQRRRRVFALADFGDWTSRPPILLEPESLRGDFAPSREAGQSVTRGFEVGPSGGRFTDVTPTLDCRAKNGPMQNQIGAGVLAVSVALRGREGGGTAELGGPVSGTLRASGGGGDKQHVLIGVQRPVRVAEPVVCAATGQSGAEITTDYCPTLNCNHEAPYVAFGLTGHGEYSNRFTNLRAKGGDCGGGSEFLCVAPTMGASGPPYSRVGGSFVESEALATFGMQVRRLTPTECERLQGFPDGHTAITVRGKPAADGPRYKALGNSMAVPVMAWIGKQIDDVVMFY